MIVNMLLSLRSKLHGVVTRAGNHSLLRLSFAALFASSLLAGCATMEPKAIYTPDAISQLAPADLVVDSEKDILFTKLIEDEGGAINAVAGQGGLIGSLVGSATISIIESNRRSDLIKELGTPYQVIESLDKDALFTESVCVSPGTKSIFGGQVSALDGMNSGKLLSVQRSSGRPTLVLKSEIQIPRALDSVALCTGYSFYAAAPAKGNPRLLRDGRIYHVLPLVKNDSDGIDADTSLERMKKLMEDPAPVLGELYSGVLDDVLFDMSTDACLLNWKTTDFTFGYNGKVVGAEGDRFFIRTRDRSVYSLPMPPIVGMDVHRVAIVKNVEDDSGVEAMIAAVLQEKGLEVVTVDSAKNADGVDVVLVYDLRTGSMTFVGKTVAEFDVKLLNPEDLSLVGSGRYKQYPITFRHVDKVLRDSLRDAFGEDIKAAIKQKADLLASRSAPEMGVQ